MNSEHISSEEIRGYYGLEIIEKCGHGDKCKIKLFGCELIKSISGITNSLRKMRDVENMIALHGDQVDSYFINNGNIWFTVLTHNGGKFKTDIGGCIKRYKNRDKFIDTVENNGDKLLSSYIDAHTPVYIDHGCGHEAHKVTPNNYLNGAIKCPICTHSKIVPYINDCYTLRPDLLKYFKNTNDAVGVAVYDHKYKEYYCPVCGQPKTTSLSNIVCFGFSCSYCSDGVSYPEKVMSNVLSQINVNFITQKKFDWSYYYDASGKRHDCKYDFVVLDDYIIIETDGGFHYNEYKSMNVSLSLEERQNIDRIKDKLAKENGYSIIRINCDYHTILDRFDYIKHNIIKSLSSIYDLKNVDWDIVDKVSEESKIEKACFLWETDNRMTTAEIAERLNTNQTSVIQYLNIGARLGICKTYSKEMSNKRQAKNRSSEFYKYVKAVDVHTNNLIGVFYDIDNFIFNYFKMYGVLMKKQCIRDITDNKSNRHSHKGLSFYLISKDEYLTYVNNCKVNDILDNPSRIIVMSSTHLYDDDLLF